MLSRRKIAVKTETMHVARFAANSPVLGPDVPVLLLLLYGLERTQPEDKLK